MSNEVLIPPWIIPQAETTTLVDDSTSVFRASFAPGVAQRVSYVEPRLQVKQSFKGLRGAERAAMLAVLNRAKGKFCTVRALVGYALRGSFPATELFVNNDFASGVSPWTSDATMSIAAIDHGLRVSRIANGGGSACAQQSVSIGPGVPYSIRGFLNGGAGSPTIFMADLSLAPLGSGSAQGMLQTQFTARGSITGPFGFYDPGTLGPVAGNFFDAKWSSLARCAQVDNGINSILNSDIPGSTSWTLSAATAASTGASAPDGSTSTWAISETVANAAHFTSQAVTVPSAAADFSFSIFVRQSSSPRGFAWVQMTEGTGSTLTAAWINLSTGAVTNITTGANWSAISALSVNYGNGWWRFILTARKTNAATSINCLVGPAQVAGLNGYAGSTSAFVLGWRASFAQSSVPVQPIVTTSAAVTGTNQIGNTINIKGLPASTAGLLLEGDPFEINGELKLCQSALSSDASGLGILQFNPSLCRSPSDGDGVVIGRPMGKFILAADASWVNDFGVYADIDISLEAINE